MISAHLSGLQDDTRTAAKVPIESNEAKRIDFKFFILIIFLFGTKFVELGFNAKTIF
jgi:hypothetical protein